MPFKPRYKITAKIAQSLMRIGSARQAVADLPITPGVLAKLRQTARLRATHYSTLIEGNRLTQEQVAQVIESHERIADRDRDQKEVLGYFAGLDFVERTARTGTALHEHDARTIHALVMAGGKKRVKPTPYRDGQNVIRDARTRAIVYLPPEAADVPGLMQELFEWAGKTEGENLPCPLRAAVMHYQIATIHPYYDGNGRTARLLTTLVLHRGGFDLKGLYSLEEYYARDLSAYYDALTVGPSHNYYMGRAKADITGWVEYFCAGMAESFENVKHRAAEAAATGEKDASAQLRKLDAKKKRALTLFLREETITSKQIQKLFGMPERTARHLCVSWVNEGFLVIVNASKKTRSYALAKPFRAVN